MGAPRAYQGSRSQNARVIVTILKRIGQPRRVSGRVRFSDPVVTSVWCLVCNPEQPPADGGHCVHSQAAHITSSMHIACESAVLLMSSTVLNVRRLSDQGFLPKRAMPGLGVSSCMVKNEGKSGKITGFRKASKKSCFDGYPKTVANKYGGINISIRMTCPMGETGKSIVW